MAWEVDGGLKCLDNLLCSSIFFFISTIFAFASEGREAAEE